MIDGRFPCSRRASVAATAACVLIVTTCDSDDPTGPSGDRWAWSWEHPRPTGATFRGIGGWTEFDQWAVGDEGLIAHYRGLEWRAVASPTTHTLHDVVGFSPTDVFMVGEAGTILGPGLARQPSTTSNDLYSLFGFSAINLIAVGANGTIVANDGGGWQPVASPTSSDLHGVWCLTNGEKVAVGAGGVVIRSTGGPWSVVPAFTSRDLNAVWADKPGDWFAVGDGGEIWRDDGSGWSPMASPRSDDLFDVFGSDSAFVFAVGDADSILFYDRIAWQPVAPNPSGHLDAIWATICPISASADAAYARAFDATHCSNTYFAGVGGVVTRYTLFGSYEMLTDVLTSADLHGIHGPSAGDVYAVGNDGTIMRNDGIAWSLSGFGETDVYHDVFVISPLDVVIVGAGDVVDGGCVTEGADGAWTSLCTIALSDLYGVWAQDATTVFMVGDAGTVVRYDRLNFHSEPAPLADYRDVWGFETGGPLAVARGGVIARRDAGTWSQMNAPVASDLYGVWGRSVTDAYAVGGGGVILRLDSSGEWRSMDSGVSDDVVAISGSGTSVWAVTRNGAALRLEGTTWRVEELPTIAGYGGVFVRSDGRVLATGDGGAIVRFDLQP